MSESAFKCPQCGDDSVAHSPYRWLSELKRFGVQCYKCKAWMVSGPVNNDFDSAVYYQEISDQLTGKRPPHVYDLAERCPTCKRSY